MSRVRLLARDSGTARFNLVRRTGVGRPFAHSIALACSFSPASAARAAGAPTDAPGRIGGRSTEAAPAASAAARRRAEMRAPRQSRNRNRSRRRSRNGPSKRMRSPRRESRVPVAFLRAVGSSHSEWHSAQRWRARRARGRPARGRGGGGGEGAREEGERAGEACAVGDEAPVRAPAEPCERASRRERRAAARAPRWRRGLGRRARALVAPPHPFFFGVSGWRGWRQWRGCGGRWGQGPDRRVH